MTVSKQTTNVGLERPEFGSNSWHIHDRRNLILMDMWLDQLRRGNVILSGGNLTINGSQVDLDATEVRFGGSNATFVIGAETPIVALSVGTNYLVYVDSAGVVQTIAMTDAALWTLATPLNTTLLGLVRETEPVTQGTKVWTVFQAPYLETKQDVGQLGQAGGYAPLGADARLADAHDPTPAGVVKEYYGSAAPAGYLLCDGAERSATTYERLFDVLLHAIAVLGRGTHVGDFTADSGTDIFSLTAHGKVDDDVVYAANSGGALPVGLGPDAKVYIITATANTFQLSLTKGGAAIDITSNGSGINRLFDMFQLPDRRGRTGVGKDDMGGVAANRVTSAQADRVGGATGAEVHTLTQAQLAAHDHRPLVANFDGTVDLIAAQSAARRNSDLSNPGYTGAGTARNWKVSPAGGGGPHNNMQPYIAANYIIKT